MLGQTVEEMKQCAAGGCIVIVNVARLRSDAIILTPTSIRTIRLPDLALQAIESWEEKTTVYNHDDFKTRGKKNRRTVEYLDWIWKVCVKQILSDDAVLASSINDGLARIWWLASGLASAMPLHAAGIHKRDSGENAYSRAISSYIPSIQALSYTRRIAQTAARSSDQLMIASMATTPGEADLPYAVMERDTVRGAASGSISSIIELNQPTASQVSEALRSCSIAHIACHAGSHPFDPTRSAFAFEYQDESGNRTKDFLAVKDILGLPFHNAKLAYLSACQTGQNRAHELADEVVHLASAFQVAGFPHVIGCIWSARDETSKDIAELFYTALLENGQVRTDDWSIAAALRRSAMAYKAEWPDDPFRWAHFAHYGP
jgi:hypothetical protein